MFHKALCYTDQEVNQLQLLFVCTGNTCRSPMAQALMAHLAETRGWHDIHCASAGLYASVGAQVNATALAVLEKEYGIGDFSHRATQVTPALLETTDLVIAMTRDHARVLKTIAPSFDRVAVMPTDVGDPFGGDYNTYKACAKSLVAGLESLIDSGVIHD